MSAREPGTPVDDGALDAAVARLFAEVDGSAPADEVDPEPPAGLGSAGGVEASEELRHVTHRIAGQFVEVIAQGAATVLRGGTLREGVGQLLSALDALDRLAAAADDAEHAAMLGELRAAIEVFQERAARGVGHAAFRDAVRDWLPRYATAVGSGSAEALRRLTEYAEADVPLFEHLRAIRGIGPKRLQRLYAAGFYTVEALQDADVEETAQVTGLPRRLTAEVVEASLQYRARKRERLVEELPRKVEEFARLLRDLENLPDPALRSRALASWQEMHRLIASMEADDEVE